MLASPAAVLSPCRSLARMPGRTRCSALYLPIKFARTPTWAADEAERTGKSSEVRTVGVAKPDNLRSENPEKPSKSAFPRLACRLRWAQQSPELGAVAGVSTMNSSLRFLLVGGTALVSCA